MAGKPTVTVVLTADDKDLSSDLNKAEKSMKGLVNPATIAFAAIAAGAIAAAVAVKKIVAVLNEWEVLANKQIRAERMLATVVRSTGEAAGFTVKEMQEYASQLQLVTNYGDEDIIPMMAKLATFTSITGDVFKRTSMMALNMGEMFGSIEGASIQLGKALNDPVKGVSALAKVGVSFTETEKDTIAVMMEMNDIVAAQTLILDALANQGFGGLATSMADVSIQTQNAIGDVKELGGSLWKAFKEPLYAEALAQINAGMGDMSTAANELDTEVRALSTAIIAISKGAMPAWRAELEFVYAVLMATAKTVPLVSLAFETLEDAFVQNYEAAKKGIELDKQLLENREARALGITKVANAEKAAAKELLAIQNAAKQADKDMAQRGGILMPTFEIDDTKLDAELQKVLDKSMAAEDKLREYANKDEGFNASIEGLLALNSRITSTAASRKPEDMMLKQLQDNAMDAKKLAEEAQTTRTEQLNALKDLNVDTAFA